MRSAPRLTARSVVATAILFALPTAGHATTANDLCLPTADPCVVSTTVNVTTGSITYSSVTPPISGQDFIAILFGDTTGNWTPP